MNNHANSLEHNVIVPNQQVQFRNNISLDELIFEIFSFNDYDTIHFVFSQVCKQWRNVVFNEKFWNYYKTSLGERVYYTPSQDYTRASDWLYYVPYRNPNYEVITQLIAPNVKFKGKNLSLNNTELVSIEIPYLDGEKLCHFPVYCSVIHSNYKSELAVFFKEKHAECDEQNNEVKLTSFSFCQQYFDLAYYDNYFQMKTDHEEVYHQLFDQLGYNKEVRQMIIATLEYMTAQEIYPHYKCTDHYCLNQQKSEMELTYYTNNTTKSTMRRITKLRNKIHLIYIAYKNGRSLLVQRLLKYGFVATPDQIARGVPDKQTWKKDHSYWYNPKVTLFEFLQEPILILLFYQFLIDNNWNYHTTIKQFEAKELREWVRDQRYLKIPSTAIHYQDILQLINKFGFE
jgi:hypothetical protein